VNQAIELSERRLNVHTRRADGNPCRGVHRNRERPREPMIDDAEAAAVYAVAVASLRRMMTLIYATCQRPEDCLLLGPANIERVEKDGCEIRVLRVRQAKTGKSLDIEVTGDIEKLARYMSVAALPLRS